MVKSLFKCACIVALLSGCASIEQRQDEQFERTAVTMNRVDITYCDADGFESFQDLGRYWSFVCKDGRKFIVKYK